METQKNNDTVAAVTAPADAANQPAAEAGNVDKLIAEAEQRGYERGRNEAAHNFINRTDMFEEVHAPSRPVQSSPLLSPRRISIWDLP